MKKIDDYENYRTVAQLPDDIVGQKWVPEKDNRKEKSIILILSSLFLFIILLASLVAIRSTRRLNEKEESLVEEANTFTDVESEDSIVEGESMFSEEESEDDVKTKIEPKKEEKKEITQVETSKFQKSKYAENPLVYKNSVYDYSVIFPDVMSEYFTEEGKAYSNGYSASFDWSETGENYQEFGLDYTMPNGIFLYRIHIYVSTENDSSAWLWRQFPTLYKDDEIEISIMPCEMRKSDFLNGVDDEIMEQMWDDYKKIAKEVIVVTPDGKSYCIEDYMM